MKRRTPFDIEFLLESLTNLREDPDNVGGVGDNNGLNWSDGDNIAFFTTKTFSILAPGGMHQDIMKKIRLTRTGNARNLDQLDNEGMIVSDENAFLADLYEEGGILFDYFYR